MLAPGEAQLAEPGVYFEKSEPAVQAAQTFGVSVVASSAGFTLQTGNPVTESLEESA